MNDSNRRVVISNTTGCAGLFGLPFFLAGLAVMTSPLWGDPKTESGEPAPLYFVIPFGMVFAAVGGGIMFYRSKTIIDRDQGTIHHWWGILIPMKHRYVKIDDVSSITITREIRKSDKSTYTVYPVRAEGTGEALKIKEPRDYNQARAEAERIAKVIQKPIHDKSSGKTVVREPHELDVSVRDRIQQSGEKIEIPPAPVSQKSKFNYKPNGDLEVEIPPPGFQAIHLMLLAGAMIMPVFVLAMFGRMFFDEDMDPMGKLFFGGFIGIFFVLGPLLTIGGMAVKHALTREFLEVSGTELRLKRKGPLGSKTTIIPVHELEELEICWPNASSRNRLGHQESIVARSDRTSVQFGGPLEHEELNWLHSTIKFVIANKR